MKGSYSAIAAIIFAGCATHVAQSAELQPSTLKAWNAYSKRADTQMQERAAGRVPFLWTDESPDREARARRGEVIVEPVVGRGSVTVPNGLIHHWVGAIFIPGAKIESTWAVFHDYDNYSQIYQPVVLSSTTLARTDTSQEYQMVWQRKVLFITAAMQGRYQTHDIQLDAHRAYSLGEAVEVREIEGYGHKRERLLPADTGNGYIWRIRGLMRCEERDGGVYVELEAMVLTRDIPASLAWMVNPIVNRLSFSSLAATLRQTRDAVVSQLTSLEASGSHPNRARNQERSKGGGE